MESLNTNFEELLLAHLVRNKQFFSRYQTIIKEIYFENQIYRDIYSRLKEYYSKYQDSMTKEVLWIELSNILRPKLEKLRESDDKTNLESLYRDEIDKFWALDLSSGEEYTSDIIVSFAQRQEMKRILRETNEKVEKRQVDIAKVSQRVAELQMMSSKVDMGYDYFDDTVSRTSYVYEEREHVVSTGFKRLNKYLGKGLAGGELGIVVGPPSRGKTAMLVNLAVGGMIGRKNIIYFVFEGSREDIAVRFDMRIAGLSKDQLPTKTQEARDHILYFNKLLKTKLIIKMYPTESATVRNIEEFLDFLELANKFIPDLIIIDYLNLCKRSNPKEDSWLGANYREGKAMAVRRNRPVWSAVQAKMDSLRAMTVSPRYIAEATGRVWADSDVIIGLCQSEEEEAKKPMEMRLYIGKNRNREAKKSIPVLFHNNVMMIEERPI